MQVKKVKYIYFFSILSYDIFMKTIVLTGMMGSGKTTVGKILAENLSAEFIDLDLVIEKKIGKTISEIFAEFGEDYFRENEAETLKDIFSPAGMVISLGGGAFENKKTRDFLLENSLVVYLETSPEIILTRLKNDTSRPLLCGNMSLEKIENLIKKRENNYKKASFIITTDELSPEAAAQKILGVLKND